MGTGVPSQGKGLHPSPEQARDLRPTGNRMRMQAGVPPQGADPGPNGGNPQKTRPGQGRVTAGQSSLARTGPGPRQGPAPELLTSRQRAIRKGNGARATQVARRRKAGAYRQPQSGREDTRCLSWQNLQAAVSPRREAVPRVMGLVCGAALQAQNSKGCHGLAFRLSLRSHGCMVWTMIHQPCLVRTSSAASLT